MRWTWCSIRCAQSWTFPLAPRIWSNMHRPLGLLLTFGDLNIWNNLLFFHIWTIWYYYSLEHLEQLAFCFFFKMYLEHFGDPKYWTCEASHSTYHKLKLAKFETWCNSDIYKLFFLYTFVQLLATVKKNPKMCLSAASCSKDRWRVVLHLLDGFFSVEKGRVPPHLKDSLRAKETLGYGRNSILILGWHASPRFFLST